MKKRNIIKGSKKMDIKGRYKEAKFIKNKLERLEEEINNIEYLRGVDTTRENIQTSNITDLSDTVIRTEYINQKIEEWKEKLHDYITDTLKEIDKIDNEAQYNIMFKRYIQFKSWEEIEQECHYTRRWTFNLHRRGLEKLNNIEINH